MHPFIVTFAMQILSTILSLFWNSLLIYFVLTKSTKVVGFYRWIMIGYAVFEMLYSIVILLGLPVHVVISGTWVLFSYCGPLEGTRFSHVPAALNCMFYELWLELLAIHFIYRYLAICRHHILEKIEQCKARRIVLFLSFLLLIGMAAFCGFYICTRHTLPQSDLRKLGQIYSKQNPSAVGYILLPMINNNKTSALEIFTIVDHHLLVFSSTAVILLCAFAIRRKIQSLQHTNSRRICLQKQLFLSLLLQTLTPVIFCHLPSLTYLFLPLLQTDLTSVTFSLTFTWLASIEKFIDPIIVIICIADYRKALLKTIGRMNVTDEMDTEEGSDLVKKSNCKTVEIENV